GSDRWLKRGKVLYLEKYRLNGRTAVVTGGAQAIGLACAEALCEAGASVIIADLNPTAAEAACEQLRTKGHAATSAILDVTNSGAVQALADSLDRDQRGAAILVCNAGIARSETPAQETADEHWLNVLDVNLNGVVWFS